MDELGYDCEWQVLNSKNFGVPQNRERVFIIGHSRKHGRREVFPIPGTDGETGIPVKQVAHRKGYNCNTRTYDPTGISGTLDTAGGGGREIHILEIINKKGELKESNTKGQYASCLTGGGHSGGNHSDMDLLVQAVLTPDRAEKRQNGRRIKEDGEPMSIRIRRLSPLECWRLQGFPDSVFRKVAEVNSDSQLYKQAGNSVTVNVIKEIGERLT